MHEAYQITPLLKLQVQVESIAVHNDKLLLGTRQGHLCIYSVVRNDEKSEVQLIRYEKSFSKKPIQQLEVIPEFNLLVSLTDNLVQLHDINATNSSTTHQILNSKGATLFALNNKKTESLTGEVTTVVRLAIAVKRKLQLYYLKNNEFHTLMNDINLDEIPRSMVWLQETICVGYRGEYTLIQLGDQQMPLFPTSSSRSSDPCIVRVSDTTFALCRESQTVLVNVKGETEKTKALKWSEVPSTLAWDEPYALAVLSDSIEIQALDPAGIIQTLTDLPKVRFVVSCGQGLLYASSISQVWCIQAVDVAKQRMVLLDDKHFQLALKLTSVSNESEEEKLEKIHHIQTLLAYDLFAKKQFRESMTEFLKLGTDPYDVIRLFPDLLPQQAGSLESLETGKDLTDKELEMGLLALIDYLTEIRRLHSKAQGSLNASGNLNNSSSTNKTTQQLLQIIDTTLLKCYLQTNDALVAPLLRLNHCHLGETEKILKKMGKHNELIILYQTKGQHRRVLELLESEGAIERAIGYLQHLGIEHIGLILEFADWILKANPEEGLKIFTEEYVEVEGLPRPRILDFLLRSHSSIVIPYLEHVVHVWEDKNTLFHNALIHQYREKAMSEAIAGDHIRKKLIEFLETSTYYTADTVLGHFPTDSLLEERAIILGRLGRHDQAIGIYIRALGDIEKAVEYCNNVYQKRVSGYEKVYASVIKLLLDPDCCPLALPGLKLSPLTAQPDKERAISLLNEYASKIGATEALSILPDDIPVARISRFLLVTLQKAQNERRQTEVLKGLLYAENLQCQELKLNLQRQRVLVTEMNVCSVCKKRFGNQSALVRYPNGDVVHFSCQERKP